MKISDLAEEQKKAVRECKTPEELLELTKKFKYTLSDEELDQVTGGKNWLKKFGDDCAPELGQG